MEDLKLVERVCRRFTELYGASPRLFRSPGRANLIGEHTDYNDGFVMPFAIDRETVVAAASGDDRKIRVAALDVNESATIDLDAEPQKLRHRWIDYVEGTARSLAEKHDIGGANIVFASSVPIGAGLSSSAALEVSIGFALLSIYKQQIDLKTLALAAQRAEHEFVGIRSGIMDQFASAFGREGQAMLLDCRSMEIEYIPIDVGDAVIAVCDTKVKHELAATEYNTRREECEKGVEILRTALPHIKALRDVSVTEFKTYEDLLPEPIRSRCRHVVTENERTLEAAELFKAAKLNGVGRLMFESHASLRDDYEVSCPELDTLVDSAQNVDGIYGSRMTGGGFGGCTVNLLRSSALENFRDILTRDYRERFGTIPDIYVFNAADGVSEITL
ncbi:MAG: galactokinase [Pyrinomonadaceae bacterium]